MVDLSNIKIPTEPRGANNEELAGLISTLAGHIRSTKIPSQFEAGLTIDHIKCILGGDNKLREDLENWENGREKGIRKVIDSRLRCRRRDAAISYICKSVEGLCGSEVDIALYNGAGSFHIQWRRAVKNLRQAQGYTIIAQSSVLGGPASGIRQFAIEILDGQNLMVVPLYSKNALDELFHGVLIAKFDKDREISKEEQTKLKFMAYYMGAEMTDSKPDLYACPAVNGGEFQCKTERLIKSALWSLKPAKPSYGLSPWIVKDDLIIYESGFCEVMDKNIKWCSPDKTSREELISAISDRLKVIFSAIDCFYFKYKKDDFECDGQGSDIHKRTATISAAIGAPYQTSDGDKVVISIPQYTQGRFIGASIIVRDIDEPPLQIHVWRKILYFCQYVFNSLYAGAVEVPNDLYSLYLPWYGYIDVWQHCHLCNDAKAFPPSILQCKKDVSMFGKEELSQISNWLAKYIRLEGLASLSMATWREELAGLMGLDEAAEFHQASTTTIMDLCGRAKRDEWPKTVRSIFSEAFKFFSKEEVHLMWFAVHKGGLHFDIFHSGDGELADEDSLACEILAQWTALQNTNFFVSHDNPDLIYKLIRSRVGDKSLVVIPIYNEDEVEETEDGWRKKPGRFMGVFTVVVSPHRPAPTKLEWHHKRRPTPFGGTSFRFPLMVSPSTLLRACLSNHDPSFDRLRMSG